MGILVGYFDIWQAGYAGASVAVYAAGTSTLLSIYSDEALTVAAANPQTLSSMSQSGRNFGKFATPLYVGSAYELSINGSDRTGVINVPITSLDDEDASSAKVTAAGSSTEHYLYDIVARNVDAVDSGVFLPTSNPAASASTNNATLVASIGKAAALGGGIVRTPAGTYSYTLFSIPANVLVQGGGRGVTILQSQTADKTVTFAGDRAGLAELTLDGVNLGAGSIGVFSKAKNETRFNNVTLKRFETCLSAQGGRRADWKDLYIDNAVTGAKLKGDINLSGASDGDEFRHNEWNGGLVTNCTTAGVHLGFVDRKCWHNSIKDVGFESNSGIALKCTGARWTDLGGCWWTGNATDLVVEDGSDTTLVDENSTIGLHISNFLISAAMSFTGKCQDVIFDAGEFASGTYTLTTVGNSILVIDSTESSTVSIAGNDATQWMRKRRSIGDYPNSSGVTTDATSTEAWSYDLAPGEKVFLEAKVVANGKNVNEYAVYHISQGAYRLGSTLAYDGQTTNFTKGAVLTGATSGATALIIEDSDSGATGTVTLRNIIGEFVDDEAITDSSGGAAFANGVMAHQAAALMGAITSLTAAVEADAAWACIFGVTAGKVRVMVAGAAAKTIDWTVAVQVTSG
uniref:Uncharacterized protein n=1 Tax=viral metagenome TaxID=1070528 RepID=A0A6M3IU31_9ZZZZ